MRPSECKRLAKYTHSLGNWEIMKARFVFTPLPLGGSVMSPTPARPSGLWFVASSGKAPALRKSAAGITHSLYAGMICVREGTVPTSKLLPVNASVSVSNLAPPRFDESMDFNEWKKNANRSPASLGKRESAMGFIFLFLRSTSSWPSAVRPAASTRLTNSCGLMYDSSQRLWTICIQTCRHPGPKALSKRFASRPSRGLKSTSVAVFLRSLS
mmetsp:Transcript_57959/g.180118  ORF Transcript_57959/g.180118 Transcript_57959/m.180118 type:complete len:213 (-) Transcript_57959:427-1065(-)